MSKSLVERVCMNCGRSFLARRHQIKIGTGNYCSRRCYAINQKELPLEERFWNKVDKREHSECWPFTGSKNEEGYGRMSKGHSKIEGAHRISYRINKGEIPKGMVVLHTCDNPSCCNPGHLKLGTQNDNIQDMINKGRNVIPARKYKLSEDQMKEIKSAYTGERGQKKFLSIKYGVVLTTITNILNSNS